MSIHYTIGPTVRVHVDKTQTYTTAIATLGGRTGVGTSKRNPRDPWRPGLGEALAKSRALADLGEQLAVAAEGGIFGPFDIAFDDTDLVVSAG